MLLDFKKLLNFYENLDNFYQTMLDSLPKLRS